MDGYTFGVLTIVGLGFFIGFCGDENSIARLILVYVRVFVHIRLRSVTF